MSVRPAPPDEIASSARSAMSELTPGIWRLAAPSTRRSMTARMRRPGPRRGKTYSPPTTPAATHAPRVPDRMIPIAERSVIAAAIGINRPLNSSKRLKTRAGRRSAA
jgi:hypothetical protein